MHKINKLQGYIDSTGNRANIHNNFKWNIICKNIESLQCAPEILKYNKLTILQ